MKKKTTTTLISINPHIRLYTKSLYTFVITLIFISSFLQLNAQYTSIPDANFEAALETLGYDDISGDGQVPTANIETVTDLDIRNKSITDISGIEDFTILKELRANQNLISSIDLSQNTALELLFIGNNDITALDLTANINLEEVDISELNLGSIDISNNTKLIDLDVENCNLYSIDVSQNIALEELNLEGNFLTALDISTLVSLKELVISDNQLSSIDISNNTLLETIIFKKNNFTTLDFSNLSNLTRIDGSGNNNLTTINLEGTVALEIFQVNTAALNSLDLSDAVNLNFLSIISSQLESLDLSNNTALTTIQVVNNNLTSLDLRNIDVTQISFFTTFGNDNLECISVSDVALAQENLSADYRYSIDCGAYAYVPDDNFEAALAAYDDIPNDDNIPIVNIESLTSIDVSSQNIIDLTGIEAFVALTSLNASENGLEQIDLSNNTALQTINLEENALKILDVSSLANLTSLEVDKNELFSLNIQNGNNTNLSFFDASENGALSCILVDNETYAITNFTNIDNQTSFSETDCTVYVTIPDLDFEAELEAYDDIPGDAQVPLANIYFIEVLDISNEGITDITGIEAFKSLKELDCSENDLTTVDVSDNVNLVYFRADSCPQLASINVVGCTLIEEMILDDNNLSTIDLSTNVNLRILDLDNNNFTSIDLSNNILLEDLDLHGNQFESFDPALLVNLTDFNIDSNKLTAIDVSKNILIQDLDLDGNLFTNLDLSALTAATSFDIDDNPLLVSVLFPEAPNLVDVVADATALETVDISMLPGLEELDLGDTNLKTLDISANIVLNDLRVDNAALVSLDLRNGNNGNFNRMNATGNASLVCIMVDDANTAEIQFTDIDNGVTFSEVTCGYTLIPDTYFEQALDALGYDDISLDGKVPTAAIEVVTSLDINTSGVSDLTGIEDFTSLEILDVTNCLFDDLDFSGNSTIKELTANYALDGTLNVSNMTALEKVVCYETGLNQLITTGATALKELDIYRSSMSSLDVSANTALEIINAYESSLMTLNTDGATSLKELIVYRSSIENLDLSTNIALEKVECHESDLVTINTNGATVLKELYVQRTNITAIDVTTNTALTILHCYDNSNVTALDVSTLVALEDLDVARSNIMSLDLSTNTSLSTIDVSDNELVSLDIRNGNNTNINSFDATGNSDLTCIGVDDVTYSTTNWTNIDGQTSFNETSCDTVVIAPKVFLQGAALNPNTGEESLMRDDLRVAGGLYGPNSPYGDSVEMSEAVGLDEAGSNSTIDWIWVELRDATDPTQIIAGQSAILQRDGDIVDVAEDRITPITFEVDEGDYYIVIKHRNHLAVMTSGTINLSSTITTVDFTDGSVATYGTNAQTTYGMPAGVSAMWAGDANGDGSINLIGSTNDANSIRDTILNDPINQAIQFYGFNVTGYNVADVNLTGGTQMIGSNNDANLVRDNILNHPINTIIQFYGFNITEQLPENVSLKRIALDKALLQKMNSIIKE